MVNKYIILSDSDNIEPFIEPRQLTRIGNETLVGRTIRLLKENGIEDILITSHDKRFDNLGAVRYEPKYNDYKPKQKKGYWLSAFPIELLNEPVVFLLGDCYYSEKAIKTIINSNTDSVIYFCSYKNTDIKYIKHHDEPFGFKVVNYNLFKDHIQKVKTLKDEGKINREPIAWELYRSLNDIDVNKHIMTNNYIAINDESCDIDTEKDIQNLIIKIGGFKMIKCEVIEEFTLEKFDELKNIKRAREDKNEKGRLYLKDTFECNKEMVDYLAGNNRYKTSYIKVIEIVPEEKKENRSIVAGNPQEKKAQNIKKRK